MGGSGGWDPPNCWEFGPCWLAWAGLVPLGLGAALRGVWLCVSRVCVGWVGVGEPRVELGGLTGRAAEKSLPAGPERTPWRSRDQAWVYMFIYAFNKYLLNISYRQ